MNSLAYYIRTEYNSFWSRLKKHQERIIYNGLKYKSVSTIKRVDRKEIPVNINEIRLFAIMRNESLRISHFINYYINLGVDRLFIIDNNSTDNSIELSVNHEKIHVFSTNDDYKNHWYWMEHMLETYAEGHWCVVVDIDELLYWPHFDSIKLPDLCKYLDQSNISAVRSLLLDMYSDKSLPKVTYNSNRSPLEVLTFFDKDYTLLQFPFFDRKKWNFFSQITFAGGVRERFFGENIPYILSKISPFKYMADTYLTQGMHAISGNSISDLQFVTFHTKFLNDFIEEVKEESKREQHYDNAIVYKIFNKVLNERPECILWNEDSVRLEDFSQLIDLGLLKTNEQFEEFAQRRIDYPS